MAGVVADLAPTGGQTRPEAESVSGLRSAVSRLRMDRWDVIGAGLVVAFAMWTLIAAAVGGGNPLPQIVVLATAVVAYLVGRLEGRDRPVAVAAVVVAIILMTVLFSGVAVLAGGPTDPPLGYGNANGALYAIGVAAAAMIASLASQRALRVVAAALAVVFLALAALTTSKAATILAISILAIPLLARRLDRRIAFIAFSLMLLTVGLTIVVGARHNSPDTVPLEALFTKRRAELWHDAMEIAAQEPLFGVGPGQFAHTSPTALSDADARWAHSAYLQAAAETGVLGALLLGALVLWGFVALHRSERDPRLVVLGVATAVALAIHAAIDYVMHFPVLVIFVALLVGTASSRSLPPAMPYRNDTVP